MTWKSLAWTLLITDDHHPNDFANNYHSQNHVGEIKGGSQWLAKYAINFSYKLGQK
jgi:hypothetical protein